MQRVALLLLPILLACHDTLSGPEAQRLGGALADPWSDTSHARLLDLWQRLGAYPLRPDSANPGQEFTPRIDGTPVPARALVFELALEHQDSLPEACLGNRVTLVGWTLAESPEGFIVAGGDFDQPLAPPALCSGRLVPTRQPAAILRPLLGPDVQSWVAHAGSARITPLSAAAGCPFVSRDGVAYLANQGVRCAATVYWVQTDATLQPTALTEPGESRTLTLPPSRISGVRWTVDCATATNWRVACGRSLQ